MATELFADVPEEDFTCENEDLSAKPTFDRFNIREVAVNHNGQDAIWDSGALDNVTGNRYALHDFKILANPIPVKVATDGPSNFITGTGTLKFVGTNKITIAVRNVYYCENARSTLLSIASFKKSDAHFQVGNNFDTIDLVSSSGKLLLRSTFDQKTNTWPVVRTLWAPDLLPSITLSCNDLSHDVIEMNTLFKSPNNVDSSQFTWNPSNLTANEKVLLFWHCLFGHASLRQIRRLVKLKLGYGLPDEMPAGSIKCPVCAICKATRTSSLGATNRALEVLSVVVVDLMGSFDPPTMTGGKYALTIQGTHTTYSEVKVLKQKSEAAKFLVETITRWENQTGKNLKVLRSNNGGKFESKALADWVGKKGILAERSLPYHHFQNGAAERYNRTVADMGRSLLYNSSLGREFWGYTVRTPFGMDWQSCEGEITEDNIPSIYETIITVTGGLKDLPL
jgi:hypothetical protein